MPHIKFLSGPLFGQSMPIRRGTMVIGREEDCHLQLQESFVSRHHSALFRDEYTLRIRDLCSKNGTFVNGLRVGAHENILVDGDVVSIGDVTLLIELPSKVAS